ncbi:enoyl-CoA hydratase/isomerase family protein [Polaromonas sp. P1(28)-13]|nr:enoyl-CoA hydratase/isomerase family protein [Polaromonas sp. P1(28)-13]
MQAAQAVALQRRGDVGVIRIDNPPVNAISAQVVAGLEECISFFEGDVTLRALVVMCAGRTFVAGGDISSFDLPGFSAAPYNQVLARLESQKRPVVAAMHGTVLGGGFELALACHWRIATTGTQFRISGSEAGFTARFVRHPAPAATGRLGDGHRPNRQRPRRPRTGCIDRWHHRRSRHRSP